MNLAEVYCQSQVNGNNKQKTFEIEDQILLFLDFDSSSRQQGSSNVNLIYLQTFKVICAPPDLLFIVSC